MSIIRTVIAARAVVGAAVLAMAFASVQAAAEDPSAATPPVQAIWKQQEIPFYFQSFTTFYTCSSLEAKIKRLLLAMGAERGIKLRTRGCMSPHEISRTPYVQITVVSPVEATPEALAEQDKTRSTRELVARVRGDSKQAERDAAQFPAEWKRVSLARGKFYLDPGDCELIEQLQEKVLPKLAVKVVSADIRCTPHQISSAQPKLVVDALFPMPRPDETTRDGD